jgi:hypothetical protein
MRFYFFEESIFAPGLSVLITAGVSGLTAGSLYFPST